MAQELDSLFCKLSGSGFEKVVPSHIGTIEEYVSELHFHLRAVIDFSPNYQHFLVESRSAARQELD
jgi:archaellum biogenesis protein FlaJ (TadC family)